MCHLKYIKVLCSENLTNLLNHKQVVRGYKKSAVTVSLSYVVNFVKTDKCNDSFNV